VAGEFTSSFTTDLPGGIEALLRGDDPICELSL
jgi:hypothetical protein